VTAPGGPSRRGRHSSDDGTDGMLPSPWTGPGAPIGGSFPPGSPAHPSRTPGDRTPGSRSGSGLIDRGADATGPLVEPSWWSSGSTDHPDHPHAPRGGDGHGFGGQHPSGPLPPMPTGVWDRLAARATAGDDEPTVAAPRVGGRSVDAAPGHPVPADPRPWDEHTGGLDVIGANVDDETPRRRGRRRARGAAPVAADLPETADIAVTPPVGPAGEDRSRPLDVAVLGADPVDPLTDDEIPVAPYDPRGDRRRRRRRRRPFAVVLALLVLGGIVAGIVLGGQQLLAVLDPTSQDYAGGGTGSVDIRVSSGDTLSDIARTLDGADVIASTGPFVDAAEARPEATGIQPGVYTLRLQMSGQAALEAMLDPAARQVSRVTVREGLTVVQTLALVAESTGTPLAELEAAAGDPAAIGLPAYAAGMLEGFLFPATYDFEPDDTAVDMLGAMVARAEQAFDTLQIPEADRLVVLTKASIVQAEAAGSEDMAKVARVLENRLSDGMPLQLDTTVNYANGKGGITTTAADRANPSLYNTYVHVGLPPGAISNPGEEALQAVLAPADGPWRFFVVVNPDTGETRFATTGAEHQQNVLLFQQWLRENPEG
jgi:UPF0755 protein